MNDTSEARRTPLFGPFPRDGFWTALGLTGFQFFGILSASCVTFALWGGPIWSHMGKGDFGRLATSYTLIPIAVAGALLWNGKFRLSLLLSGAAVIAILKLLLTAGFDLLLGIALGTR